VLQLPEPVSKNSTLIDPASAAIFVSSLRRCIMDHLIPNRIRRLTIFIFKQLFWKPFSVCGDSERPVVLTVIAEEEEDEENGRYESCDCIGSGVGWQPTHQIGLFPACIE
jgi:hypothetical protein